MRFELRVRDFFFAIEVMPWYPIAWRRTKRYLQINLLLVALYAGKGHWNETNR